MTLLLVANVKQEAQLLLRQLALTLSKAVGYYTSPTSGDPSGQIWNYRGITLLYHFTTALLCVVSHNG